MTMSTLLQTFTKGVFFNPNVSILMKLQKDEEFYQCVKDFEYTIIDSKYLWFASRFLGSPLFQTISGSDFLPAFCNYHKSHSEITLFLLGAAPGVAKMAELKINEMSGRKMVVGEYSPPFGFEKDLSECKNIVDKVCSSKASVLILGLGAPKQEKWISKHRCEMPGVKIFMCIGAAIDFAANPSIRAPYWIRQICMEWLFRLLREPKRLWRRYLIECPPFFYLILLQKLNLYQDPYGDKFIR